MTRRLAVLVAALCSLAASGPREKPLVPGVDPIPGMSATPRTGEWTEYLVFPTSAPEVTQRPATLASQSLPPGAQSRMYYATFEGAASPTPTHWLEAAVTAQHGTAIYRIEFEGRPEAPGKALRMIAQPPDGPPIEMPPEMFRMPPGEDAVCEPHEPCAGPRDKISPGKERWLETPAGRFKVTPVTYSYKGLPPALVYMSDYHGAKPVMVRFDRDGMTMVLAGQGKNPAPKITGRPRPFFLPRLPPTPDWMKPGQGQVEDGADAPEAGE